MRTLNLLDQEAQTESEETGTDSEKAGETGADSERANSEEIASEDTDKGKSCPNHDFVLKIVAIFCIISTFL